MKHRAYQGNGCLPIIATFIIVMAIMFVVVWRSPAQSQVLCVSVETVKADAAKRFKGSKLTELSGSEMLSFLLGFNAIDPPTNVIGDSGLIVDKPNAPAVTIVIFNKGCYSTLVFVRRAEFTKLMGEMT